MPPSQRETKDLSKYRQQVLDAYREAGKLKVGREKRVAEVASKTGLSTHEVRLILIVNLPRTPANDKVAKALANA